jgi:hypothetical protein
MSDPQPPVTPPRPPNPPAMLVPPSGAGPDNRQAEVEYRKLIEYFKYLVTITGSFLTLLTLAGCFFFYTNLRDAKKDAVDGANEEARKAVAAALEAPNIRRIIDEEVRTQTKAKVDAEIAATLGEKLRTFQDEQKQISDVVILASISRSLGGYGGGSSEQFHQLINQMYDNPYQSARNIARDSLHQMATQFEKAITGPNNGYYQLNSLGYMSNQPNGQATLDLLNKPDSYAPEMFKAFVDLKKLTGWNVETFDIRGAKAWCTKHDCKLSTPTR